MTNDGIVVTGDDLRCAVVTAALDEKPTGTAGSWHRIVLVELPLPWPDDVTDHPLLADVPSADIAGRSHRILGLAAALTPSDARPDDGLRVICYRRRPGAAFDRFARSEVCAPDDDLGAIVTDLLEMTDDALATLPENAFADGEHAGKTGIRDLLICTHGTRDRCCGRFGTDLFRALGDQVPDDVRLWRTSHTGGHRFAPTGLTFPDGAMWAGLDAPLSLGLVDRSVSAATAAAHCRGVTGIDAGPAQVVDSALLADRGWDWLATERGYVVEPSTPTGQQTVIATTADDTWRAVVAPGRTVPVPPCGDPLDQATKNRVELDLVSLDHDDT